MAFNLNRFLIHQILCSWLFSIFTLGFTPLLAEDHLNFEVTVSPTQIYPGQSFEMTLKLSSDSPLNRDDIKLNDEIFQSKDNIKKLNQAKTFEDNTFIQTYKMTVFNEGGYLIPPVELEYQGKTYSTQSVMLISLSLREKDDKEMKPLYGALTLPLTLKERLNQYNKEISLFLLVFFLTLACLVFYKYLFKKRVLSPQPINPEVWFQSELSRLFQKYQSHPEDSHLITDLNLTLKKYLSLTQNETYLSQTSRECLKKLQNQFFNKKGTLKELFMNFERERFSENKDSSESSYLNQHERVTTLWKTS